MLRKSPIESAKEKKGIIKKGINNKLWISKPDSNGIYKWQEISDDLEIYKAYIKLHKEDKRTKFRYENIKKLIKRLSKKINIYYDKILIDKIYKLVEEDEEYKVTSYLVNDIYEISDLENKLEELIKTHKVDHFIGLPDLHIYQYLNGSALYMIGLIKNEKNIKEIIKNIKEEFTNYKIKTYYTKALGRLVIEIKDK
jgi:hypothetical protein